jgi:hypothetical protein
LYELIVLRHQSEASVKIPVSVEPSGTRPAAPRRGADQNTARL